MYGISAYLTLVAFLFVAALLFSGVFFEWKNKPSTKRASIKLLGITAFLILWFSLISNLYIQKARFHFRLRRLSASDVYSIQIGKHDFRDRQPIEELVGALQRSRWFEVNHGGWGDSIPMTIRRHSDSDLVIDVAKYFREQGAIISPSDPKRPGESATQAFAPELPRLLEEYGLQLPDCDTPHDRPCTPSQLNP